MARLNNDQVGSGVWLVVGVAIAFSSSRYGLGSLEAPETGFMPFLTGLVISVCAFIGLVQSTRQQRMGVVWKPIFARPYSGKSHLVFGALVAYILLLPVLGFVVCTFLFLGFLFRSVEPLRWRTVVGGSTFFSLAAYGIFEVLLKAQLPVGPWGF